VSVRDVARRAGVNHGLIHRHFGSKERLVAATIEGLVDDIRARGTDLDGAVGASPYVRVLAHALLEGQDPRRLQRAFPVVDDLLRAARSAQDQGVIARDVDVRTLTALGMAAGLGWLVFEPYLLAATGLGVKLAGRRRREARALWGRLIVGLGQGNGVQSRARSGRGM